MRILPHTVLPLVLAALLPGAAIAAQSTAYVLSTDFGSPGSLSTIDLDSRAVSTDLAAVHSDPRIRTHGNLIYVVNRFGQDNIQIIDPAQGFATIHQYSVGNGSNPQDIAFASSTKAYVSRLASSDLLIVHPTTGVPLGVVPLAQFGDSDGLPEMDRMRVVGNRLYVCLERLVSFSPTDSSLIAVIDTDTDTLIDCDPATPGIQAILLAGTNPLTTIEHDPVSGRLLVGCAGAYGVHDGGVEWIDPETLTSGGFAITGAALGGDVLDVEFESPTRAYAIVSESFVTRLIAFDPGAGVVLDTLYAPGGFSLSDVELNDRGELYVCQSLFSAPGVFVFNAATGQQLAGPLSTGLPPIEVAFDETGVLDVPVAVASASAAVASPNPARHSVEFTLRTSRAGVIEFEVFDPAGRLIRRVAAGHRSSGVHALTWDLNDASGRRVRAGIYMIRGTHGGGNWTARVVTMP